MKNLYSQFLNAKKALKILLAFTLSSMSYGGIAQVAVFPANDTTICANSALSCVTLGTIMITETTPADFSGLHGSISLIPPTGWQFCASPALKIYLDGTLIVPFPTCSGADMCISSYALVTGGGSDLTISDSVHATTRLDTIMIEGLEVQATSSSAGSGIIYAGGASGVTGITTGMFGTSFGKLAIIPRPINPAPPILCSGDTLTLTDSTAGGTWTSSSTTKATIGATTGLMHALSAGNVTITYTVGACSVTRAFTIDAGPGPILNVRNMCAWYDSIVYVTDTPITGLYSSTGVTAYNVGIGEAKIYANAPSSSTTSGLDTIFYTLPDGCSTFAVLTVNPLPQPFVPAPYVVCQGSSITLSDPICCGIFASSNPLVGAISSFTTDSVTIQGITPGATIISYSLTPTGCFIDTTLIVNPAPLPIPGPLQVCLLSTITVGDATPGGSWSSTPSIIASIDPSTGVLTGNNPGTAIVLYTLPDGCETLITATVDPLPSPIAGPTSVCIGDSQQLTDGVPGGTWSLTNGNATMDSTDGYYTGVSPGLDTAIYTIQPGNCFQVFVVTVNGLPGAISGPSSVCQGSGYEYRDTTLGGTWSTSSSTVATIVPLGGPGSDSAFLSAIDTGTVMVTYTMSSTTGCSVSETVTVNITPGAIVGGDSVCVGDSIQLIDPIGGGIWSTSDLTTATADSFSGYITGVGPGPVTIFYTVGNCPVPFSFTVNQIPSAITGPSALCQGDTATFHDALPGGTWSVGPTTTDGTINPVTGFFTADTTAGSTGAILIYYTGAGGCGPSFTSLAIYAKAPILGPNTVCQGDTLMLTNSVLNPGSYWTEVPVVIDPLVDSGFTSGGSTASFVDVLGSFPGSTTIEYVTIDGCVSSVVITVNPISAISPPLYECAGDTLTLFDPSELIYTGTWSETPSGPGAYANLNGISGGMRGVSGGVETVSFTITATGCFAIAQFTVNPLPAPITGNSTICQGQTDTMMDDSTGGTWSAQNGDLIINPTTGVTTGVSPGVDTIYYAMAGTNCEVSFVVTVNPLAPIFGPDSLCVGDSITLYDPDSGGVWSNVATAAGSLTTVTVTGDTVTYHGLSAGIDYVYYSMTGTGCQAEHTIRVNGLPGPITGIDTFCAGTSDTLRDDSLGGIWSSSAPGIAVVTTPSVGGLFGASAGTATITYALITSCYTTTTVTVDPDPSAIFGPTDVCLGHDTTLMDTTAGGTWSVSNPLVTPLVTGGEIYGASLGVDTVSYTLAVGGCYTEVAVTVEPIPVVVTNHNNIKCLYATVQLWADSSSMATRASRSYVWMPAYGLSGTTGPNVAASPTVTTVYTVVATNNATGCDSFALDTVTVDTTLANLKISGLDSICEGACDSLTATGAQSTLFWWNPITGLSSNPSNTETACPTATTTYWAVATDDLGCVDSASFTVTVNPVPIIQYRPDPAYLCKRTPLQVELYTTNTDTSEMTWAWSPDLFLSCDSCRNPILTDSSNIIYKVIGTTQYGCYDSAQVRVSVLDTNVNTIVPDTNICQGGTALLIATSHSLYSNLSVPTFLWMPDYKLSSPDSNATYATPDVTTTYSVAIHENACFSDTLSVTVFVQPFPQIGLTPASPYNTVAGTQVQLAAIVNNTTVQYYAWTPGNTLLGCDSCFNPIAVPTVTTTYVVTVGSIYGCISQDSVTIIIGCDKSQVFIANTFTPNGDGNNDRFFVQGKGISIVNYLYVYNRWGQQVFAAQNIPPNDPAAGWDGTFKGLVLEPDVFIYEVEATCELGQTFKYKGDISIVK